MEASLIVKCYQPETSVGADKVHTASVVLGEEMVVGGDLCGGEDQLVDHCDNEQDVHGPMGKHMGWVMLGPLQQLKSSSSTWALWLSKLSTRDFRFKHLCSYTGRPKKRNNFFLFWTLFWPFFDHFSWPKHQTNTYLNIILCSNHHFLAIRID